MIPKAIRAAFLWCGKHPWMVFWVITLFGGPLVLNTLKRLQAFSLPDDLSLLGTKICIWAGIALWLGSFIYAVSVTGKRSKSKAVIAVVLFVLLKTLASRLCDTPDGCYRFLLKTFAAQTHFQGDAGQSAAKDSVEKAISILTKTGLVENDTKGKLAVSALGMICAASGLQVESFLHVAEGVKRSNPSATELATINQYHQYRNRISYESRRRRAKIRGTPTGFT